METTINMNGLSGGVRYRARNQRRHSVAHILGPAPAANRRHAVRDEFVILFVNRGGHIGFESEDQLAVANAARDACLALERSAA